jgi:hypothetical protein
MDAAARISIINGILTDPIDQLIHKADESIREIIAFDEIIANTPPYTADSVLEWLQGSSSSLDESARSEFNAAVRKLGVAITAFLDGVGDEVKEGIATLGFSPDSTEADAMLNSLILNTTHRLASKGKVTSRAFLIAAESSFEILFSQLVRVVYVKNPVALPKSDYSFTLDELARYDSIDQAREALIARKIESLIREGLDEWGKWLKRTVSVSLDSLMADWPNTREIFIRRNMLVHTDGRITTRYLDEVQRGGGSIEGLEVGQDLAPSVTYLQAALQRIVALEILLVFGVISRLEKSMINGIASWLASKLEFLVQREMWEAACLIADSFDGAACKRNIELAIKVNGWLAHKNRDGLDSISKELSSWDVSGLHERYALVKGLLLDTVTGEELMVAITQRIITQFEVSTHPLFLNVRQPGVNLQNNDNQEASTNSDTDT